MEQNYVTVTLCIGMQRFQLVEPAQTRYAPSRRRSGPLPPPYSVTAAAPNLRAKFHLDRFSRLVTMHARHRHIQTDRRLSRGDCYVTATLCIHRVK